MFIYSIRFTDHFYGHPAEYVVGVRDVLEIVEGGGNKVYYNVVFKNGDVLRIYEFHQVLLKPQNNDKMESES